MNFNASVVCTELSDETHQDASFDLMPQLWLVGSPSPSPVPVLHVREFPRPEAQPPLSLRIRPGPDLQAQISRPTSGSTEGIVCSKGERMRGSTDRLHRGHPMDIRSGELNRCPTPLRTSASASACACLQSHSSTSRSRCRNKCGSPGGVLSMAPFRHSPTLGIDRAGPHPGPHPN